METIHIVVGIAVILVTYAIFKKHKLPKSFVLENNCGSVLSRYIFNGVVDLDKALKRYKKTGNSSLGINVSFYDDFKGVDYFEEPIDIRIQAYKCPNFTGARLPNCLVSLDVFGCPPFHGGGLDKNETLKALKVDESQHFIGNAIPDSVTYLEVANCPQFVGSNPPKHISEIYVDNCPNYTVDNLPDKLDKLMIQNLPNFFTKSINCNVRHFNVSNCEGFSMDLIPKSVTSLRLGHLLSEKECEQIPSQIEKLAYHGESDLSGTLSKLGFEPSRERTSSYYKEFYRKVN